MRTGCALCTPTTTRPSSDASAPGCAARGQADAVIELELELPNLRAAVRHLIWTDRLDEAADFAWSLLIYWWIAGSFAEVRRWMQELLGKQQPLSARTQGIASFFVRWGEMWQHPSDQVVAGLDECVRLFRESGDEEAAAMATTAKATARMQFPELDTDAAADELRTAVATLHDLGNTWGEASTEVVLGRLCWIRGQLDEAQEHLDRALAIARAGDDLFTNVMAGNLQSRLNFIRGDEAVAEAGFIEVLRLSARLHWEEGMAYGLEGICAVAAARGDAGAPGRWPRRPRPCVSASASSRSRRSSCRRSTSPRCASTTRGVWLPARAPARS